MKKIKFIHKIVSIGILASLITIVGCKKVEEIDLNNPSVTSLTSNATIAEPLKSAQHSV